METMRVRAEIIALLALCVAPPSFAGITTYGNGERDTWFEDVGVTGGAEITTVGFRGFPAGTSITNQYADLGVTFDGQNVVRGEDFIAYPQDGWAMQGLLDIAFEFDTPRNAIAVDYPGSIRFSLFLNGDLVGIEDFQTGGFGQFAGLVSNTPFDSVVIDRASGDPSFVDDLHFAFIPTPGGMIPLLLYLVRRHGRRRTERYI